MPLGAPPSSLPHLASSCLALGDPPGLSGPPQLLLVDALSSQLQLGPSLGAGGCSGAASGGCQGVNMGLALQLGGPGVGGSLPVYGGTALGAASAAAAPTGAFNGYLQPAEKQWALVMG